LVPCPCIRHADEAGFEDVVDVEFHMVDTRALLRRSRKQMMNADGFVFSR
jgi:hypothetical protein